MFLPHTILTHNYNAFFNLIGILNQLGFSLCLRLLNLLHLFSLFNKGLYGLTLSLFSTQS